MKKIITGLAIMAVILVSWFLWPKTAVTDFQLSTGDHLLLSISPGAPKLGDNLLSVKIVNEQGQVVKDAGLTIDYGMPAMGSMPAMWSKVAADFKNGVYQSNLNLSMLGTWNLGLTIKIPEKEPVKVNLKLSTGSKGFIVVGETLAHRGDKIPAGPVVVLSEEEEKLIKVTSAAVKVRPLFKQIRAAGVVAYDPHLVVAQEEFLSALKSDDEVSRSVAEAARRKLRIMGLSDAQIALLEADRVVDSNLLLPEQTMWIYADIYESELTWVKTGQRVKIKSVAYPEKTFSGAIKTVEPIVKALSRSNQVRILVENKQLMLKPQMYVDVYLASPARKALAAPKSAVLDTGTRQLVYLDLGSRVYEQRAVEVGPAGQTADGQEYLPIVSGLKAGDRVVTSANFLLDAQTQLSGGQSALYGGAKELEHDQQTH